MNQPLKGSPYSMSVADSTGAPTVNWPGGIGTLDAGKIPLSGGARRSCRVRRTRSASRARRTRSASRVHHTRTRTRTRTRRN